MKTPIIFWFRNDLRLHDNIALQQAIETQHPICCLYIFPDRLFEVNNQGFNRIGQYRMAHLQNSLSRLKIQLSNLNCQLHILKGNPQILLPKIALQINAKTIYAHHEFTHEEIEDEIIISKKLDLKLFWGNMIYPPSHVPFHADKSPFYYTKFMKKVITLPQAPVLPDIKAIKGFNLSLSFDTMTITADTHSKDPLEAMTSFVRSEHLLNYYQTRELFEGEQYSSFLSPFLADGSLSANTFYQLLNKKLNEQPEHEPSISKLQQQLIWRDYYRFLFLRYSKKLFYKHGIRKPNRERYNDIEAFEAWKNGSTPEPLINAFMKELRHTGFLSNRGRMLTSFYLSKVMHVNWLWGAQWFEHILVDYDVCNNYGNWAYQSGVGTDSRFNRMFSIERQIKKYDPHQSYIKKWTD